MHSPETQPPTSLKDEDAPVTVRTTISISRSVKGQGDMICLDEGFRSFSDLVEYLIRTRAEQNARV